MVHLTGDGGGQPCETDRMGAFVRTIS